VCNKETHVDGFCGDQSIAVSIVGQRKFLINRLEGLRTKVKLMDCRIDGNFAERTTDSRKDRWHCGSRLRLAYNLEADAATHSVNRVFLAAVVNASTHGPLEPECRELGRLVEQFRDEVVRAVWAQL